MTCRTCIAANTSLDGKSPGNVSDTGWRELERTQFRGHDITVMLP